MKRLFFFILERQVISRRVRERNLLPLEALLLLILLLEILRKRWLLCNIVTLVLLSLEVWLLIALLLTLRLLRIIPLPLSLLLILLVHNRFIRPHFLDMFHLNISFNVRFNHHCHFTNVACRQGDKHRMFWFFWDD